MADRFIYKHRRGTTEQWATSDSIIYDGDSHYPSAKAVYDAIEALRAELQSGT